MSGSAVETVLSIFFLYQLIARRRSLNLNNFRFLFETCFVFKLLFSWLKLFLLSHFFLCCEKTLNFIMNSVKWFSAYPSIKWSVIDYSLIQQTSNFSIFPFMKFLLFCLLSETCQLYRMKILQKWIIYLRDLGMRYWILIKKSWISLECLMIYENCT